MFVAMADHPMVTSPPPPPQSNTLTFTFSYCIYFNPPFFTYPFTGIMYNGSSSNTIHACSSSPCYPYSILVSHQSNISCTIPTFIAPISRTIPSLSLVIHAPAQPFFTTYFLPIHSIFSMLPRSVWVFHRVFCGLNRGANKF